MHDERALATIFKAKEICIHDQAFALKYGEYFESLGMEVTRNFVVDDGGIDALVD